MLVLKAYFIHKRRLMAKIVIIGAGLTGLSAAYHLEQNGFYDYKIFEKENTQGGLCRSIYQDGFTFDFTGHLLHINDPYFYDFLANILDFEHLDKINRKSFIFSHNTYSPYPFQINLHGLPTEVVIDCIEGFVKRKQFKKQTNNYYQWVLQHFGAGFGNHFFFPYQTKIFDYDIKKLSADWTSRFVPQTSLRQIIEGAVKKNQAGNIGYNAHFFYPKQGGIFYLIQQLSKKIRNKIQTNYSVKTVDMQNRLITFENGHFEQFDRLISTMPLNLLLNKIEEKSDMALKSACNKLLCNSVINFNLGIFKENISDKHWIYFPEKQFPLYRAGFYSNFCPKMAPKGCSSIYGEVACLDRSEKHKAEILAAALQKIKKHFKLHKKDILTEKIIHIDHAYVIYNTWREKNIKKIQARLNENKIYSIGRYGQWKYSSMQEAVLDGKTIADKLSFAQYKKYWHAIPQKKNCENRRR